MQSPARKIGTLKRTCVYCDWQAKRDECEYVYAQDTANSIKVDIDNIVECKIWATKIDGKD